MYSQNFCIETVGTYVQKQKDVKTSTKINNNMIN